MRMIPATVDRKTESSRPLPTSLIGAFTVNTLTEIPTASHKVFDAELLRFQRLFEAMPAAIVYENGEPVGLDRTVVPHDLAETYQSFLSYGYANGLLP